MIRKEKIRVYAAWFAAIFLFVSSRNARFSWPGIIFALMGVIIRIWACGYLQKNKSVISSGPYRYTRNPLYLGSFIIGIGFFWAFHIILPGLALIVIFAYIYYPVILDEERILEEKFGEEFREYKRHVPRIIPLNPPKSPFDKGGTEGGFAKGLTFSWENVIRNKEYNAWLGFLLALGIIFLVRSL
ncbi:MAG: isoprenylcysteine carboxylmethyltransferase family protein [bacterium]